MKHYFFLLPIALLLACGEQDVNPNSNNSIPEIIRLSADKLEIAVGEKTRITCEATGGELTYEWQVALGDIIPVNQEGSIVEYSGAACCSGSKVIACTVSNDKGSAQELIEINLLE